MLLIRVRSVALLVLLVFAVTVVVLRRLRRLCLLMLCRVPPGKDELQVTNDLYYVNASKQ